MTGDTGARSAATLLWAAVAGVLVLAFMVWLSLTSEPSVVAEVQEEDTSAVAVPPPAAEVVTAQQLEDSAGVYAGREIELTDVVVASKTGAQLLWVELPSGAVFPVKAEAAAAETIAPQAQVTVLGRVEEKTDAVLDEWVQAGVLDGEAQRTEASAGAYYIEATSIQPSGELE